MQKQSIQFRNSSGEIIPAGAALEPYGGYDQDGYIQVRKPTRDNAIDVLFSGPGEVPVDGIGQAYPCFPLAAASLATEPQFPREHFGTKAGSWQLHTDRRGFVVVGTEYNRLTDVMPSPMVESQAFDNESGALSGGISGGSNDPGPTVTIGTVQTGQECINGIITITLVDHVVYADGRSGYINERTHEAGCCGCTDPPLTAAPPGHLSCCGENSFTYPGRVMVRATGVSGNVSTWDGLAYDIVAISTTAINPLTDYTQWDKSDPIVGGEPWISQAANVFCSAGPMARVILTFNSAFDLTLVWEYSNLAAGWDYIDAGDHSAGIYKDFACDATWDLSTPLNVARLTMTSATNTDLNGVVDLQLRVP